MRERHAHRGRSDYEHHALVRQALVVVYMRPCAMKVKLRACATAITRLGVVWRRRLYIHRWYFVCSSPMTSDMAKYAGSMCEVVRTYFR